MECLKQSLFSVTILHNRFDCMSLVFIAPVGRDSALQGDPTEETAPIDIYSVVYDVNNVIAAMWYGNVSEVSLGVEWGGPATQVIGGTTIYMNAFYNGNYTIAKADCLPNHTTPGNTFYNNQLFFSYETWDNGAGGLNLAGHGFGEYDSAHGRYRPDYYWPVFKMYYVAGQFKIVPTQYDEVISRTFSENEIVEVYPYDYEDENGETITTTLTLTWSVTDTYFSV